MDPVVHLFGLTDIGNHRQSNEDAWCAGQLGGVFFSGETPARVATFRCATAPVVAIVSDGVGGSNAGEVASHIAVTCIPANLTSRRAALASTGTAETAVRRALQTADAAVKVRSAEPGKRGMCTTVSLLCLIGPRLAWWAQAGDSRIYRCRQGRLEQISRDHSPVGRLLQDGWITEAQARLHPQRNEIDQSLGDPLNSFLPDVASLELQSGDAYLICSDGLSDGLWEREIEQLVARVRTAADVRTVAESLVAAAKQASGRDNITVVLLLLEGGTEAPTAPE
ncbi:MAG: protein phosphatase 2C domain-containing protein [Verrucomicrobia bacterium]|nr:protein phosphatase 2C domain-containing protein [Verrucomicrobiota bacterium]